MSLKYVPTFFFCFVMQKKKLSFFLRTKIMGFSQQLQRKQTSIFLSTKSRYAALCFQIMWAKKQNRFFVVKSYFSLKYEMRHSNRIGLFKKAPVAYNLFLSHVSNEFLGNRISFLKSRVIFLFFPLSNLYSYLLAHLCTEFLTDYQTKADFSIKTLLFLC